MKRIIIASMAFFACAAAFAQAPARHHRHHGTQQSARHNVHSVHHAHAPHHASHMNDSVADRAEPLDSAHFNP